MRALIIGGDGLLGSHLVRKLLNASYNVRVLVQPNSDSPTLDDLPIEKMDGDLLDGPEFLAKAMQDCQVVFHVAAITNFWAPKDITWKVNYDGTLHVLEAIKKAGVDKLVFVGSASSYQYGTMDSPANETAPFPQAYREVPYMESKYAAMQEVLKAVREDGLEATTVSPTFMLGNLDFRPSSGELLRQFISKKMSVTSPGGRNFAYAPDVADALVAAVEKGRAGECYIGGGTNMTYLDFFSEVARQAGIEPPKRILPKAALLAAGAVGSVVHAITHKPVALNYTMAKLSLCGTYYSPQKAIQELGMPQTPTHIGIKESIASLRTYGHIN